MTAANCHIIFVDVFARIDSVASDERELESALKGSRG